MFGSALICMSPYISAQHRDRKTSLWDEIWNNNKIPFLICDSVTYIWEHCLDLTFNSLFLSTSRSVSNRLLISSLPNKIIWGITWKSQWGDNFVCWLLGMGFLADHNAEGRLLKMRILVCGPLPTFLDPTSHSKMSGLEISPNPTLHFTFLTTSGKWDTWSEKSEMGRHIAISTPNQ